MWTVKKVINDLLVKGYITHSGSGYYPTNSLLYLYHRIRGVVRDFEEFLVIFLLDRYGSLREDVLADLLLLITLQENQ